VGRERRVVGGLVAGDDPLDELVDERIGTEVVMALEVVLTERCLKEAPCLHRSSRRRCPHTDGDGSEPTSKKGGSHVNSE